MAANSNVVERDFIVVDGGLSTIDTPIQIRRIVTVRTEEVVRKPKRNATRAKIATRLNDGLAAMALFGTAGFCFWRLLWSLH